MRSGPTCRTASSGSCAPSSGAPAAAASSASASAFARSCSSAAATGAACSPGAPKVSSNSSDRSSSVASATSMVGSTGRRWNTWVASGSNALASRGTGEVLRAVSGGKSIRVGSIDGSSSNAAKSISISGKVRSRSLASGRSGTRWRRSSVGVANSAGRPGAGASAGSSPTAGEPPDRGRRRRSVRRASAARTIGSGPKPAACPAASASTQCPKCSTTSLLKPRKSWSAPPWSARRLL